MARTRITRVVGLCVLFSASLGACAAASPHAVARVPSTANASASRLIGSWNVISVAPSDAVAIPTRNHPDLTFNSDGSVSGDDSVNHFDGRFSVTGNQLTITDTRSTLVGLGPGAPKLVVETVSAYAELTSGKPVTVGIVGRTMRLDCGAFALTAVRR